MKTKIAVLAFMAVTAGVLAFTLDKNAPPSDLRDAVADTSFKVLKGEAAAESAEEKVPAPATKPFYVETGSRRVPANKGYVAGNDPSVGPPDRPVEWVAIPAGKFTMGTDNGETGFDDAKPIHEVTIRAFEMSKTAVTIEQYAECVLKGGCKAPDTGNYCNWGERGRQLHPVNCVSWDQAQAYAKFKGVRLPTEAEFEYAATSGGKNQKYPWGNGEPTIELAVFNTHSTMPVCSKPKGNTAQGLCDMSGNVGQWVQDKYQGSYNGAPADGSAFEGAGSRRVMRGGSFYYDDPMYLRADSRMDYVPGYRGGITGFRLARSR